MRPLLILLSMSLSISLSACAGKHAISGAVVDRNGRPVDRVILALEPGDVEMITDAEGAFVIDYLRDANGKRIRLDRKTNYKIELLKPGFHKETVDFYYKKGDLVLDTITLKEDTIRVEASPEDIDPGRFQDRSQSEGSTYEGE